MGASWQLTTDT